MKWVEKGAMLAALNQRGHKLTIAGWPPAVSTVRRGHGLAHQREAAAGGFLHGRRGLAAPHASLDDLQCLNRMLVIVLGVLFEPPSSLASDFLVPAEPAERLLGDLLRNSLDGIVRRRHRRSERSREAHVGEVVVEGAHLGNRWLRTLEALP